MQIQKVTITQERDDEGYVKVIIGYEDTNPVIDKLAKTSLTARNVFTLAVLTKALATIFKGNETLGVKNHEEFFDTMKKEVMRLLGMAKEWGVSTDPKVGEHEN